MTSADQLRTLFPFAGMLITITRTVPAAASVELYAVHGRKTGQAIGNDHLQTEYTTDDWLIVIEDLGTFGKPKRGDLITVDDRVYRVGHPNKSTSVVVDHGNDNTAYRVHSIQDVVS